MKKVLALIAAILCLVCCTKTEIPYIEINGNADYTLTESAVVVPVRISTNQDDWGYDLGAASSWISVQSVTEAGLELVVSANTSYDVRNAEIKFFAPMSTKEACVILKLSQAGKMMEPEMSTDPSGYAKVSYKENTLEIKVNTNLGSWGYTANAADWLSFTKNDKSLSVKVAENTVDSPRKAEIKFFAPDSESPVLTQIVNIEQEPAEIEYEKEDLSANATANSYVIYHKGPYSFNAKVRGNGKTTSKLAPPATLSPAGAKLVWQTAKGMITSVKYDADNGTIEFEASRTPGNALVAATDANGKIIWSWHIWYPEVEIEGITSSSGSEFMNINLGALNDNHYSVKSYGLLYQWGRKDPFPGSPVMDGGNMFTINVDVYDQDGNIFPIGSSSRTETKENTIEYSIQHPYICISSNAQQPVSKDWLVNGKGERGLWGNPDGYILKNGKYINHGEKSFYDPCPAGWRVPSADDFAFITSVGGYNLVIGEDEKGLIWSNYFSVTKFSGYDYTGDGKVDLQDYYDGWHILMNEKTNAQSYFPATARYDGIMALLMGSVAGYVGNYWYNTQSETIGTGMSWLFAIKTVTNYNTMEMIDEVYSSTGASGSCADAYAVRCVRE